MHGAVTVALVSAIVLTAVPATAVTLPADRVATAPTQGPQVTLSAATARAAATGDPVVVDALTTPTSLTKAMPDGSMQLEQSSVPVRVQQGGSWVPVNTGLVRDGDWFSPAASAVPVRFSPGGRM